MDSVHQPNENFQGSLPEMGLPSQLLHHRSAQENLGVSIKLLNSEGRRHLHPVPDTPSPSFQARGGDWMGLQTKALETLRPFH